MGKSGWILFTVLAVLNLLLFWPGNFYFLNDDFIHIPLTDQNQLFQTNAVRPMHELLVKLDLLLWGKKTWGFHLTALILHFIVAFQLYGLAGAIQRRWSGADEKTVMRTSLFAVVLFMMYPQHSESLAWILGRTPTLSCIFFLVTLRLFFSRRIEALHVIAGVGSFLLALFTYEQVVLMPLVLLTVCFFDRDAQKGRRTLFAVLLLVAVGVYVTVRKLVTTEVIGGYEGGNLVAGRIDVMASNFLKLVARLWTNPGLSMIALSLGAIGGALIIGSLVWRYRRQEKKSLLFLGAGIIVLLLPMVSLGISTRSFESGRYLYIPSVFFTILLAALIGRALTATRYAVILPVVILVYWFMGKATAALHYKLASDYSSSTMEAVDKHFRTTNDTLRIDTLQTSVQQLPVFRLGFKEGARWLHGVDTGRVIITYYRDE